MSLGTLRGSARLLSLCRIMLRFRRVSGHYVKVIEERFDAVKSNGNLLFLFISREKINLTLCGKTCDKHDQDELLRRIRGVLTVSVSTPFILVERIDRSTRVTVPSGN